MTLLRLNQFTMSGRVQSQGSYLLMQVTTILLIFIQQLGQQFYWVAKGGRCPHSWRNLNMERDAPRPEKKYTRQFAKLNIHLNNGCPAISLPQQKKQKRLNGYMAHAGSKGKKSSELFGAMAYGKNVNLNAHTDEDFAYSMTLIHKKDCVYSLRANLVIYFAFTDISHLVPLRPGDMLIFNPQHAHCISSQINVEDEIYCASLYLKTRAVGGNDNSLPSTAEQEAAAALDKLFYI